MEARVVVHTGRGRRPWFLLADAERRLSSSFTGLLIAAGPLVGTVLAWRTGAANRLDRRRVGGLLVGLFAVAVLLGFNATVRDCGAIGEVLIASVGCAVGPMIIARRLGAVPAVGGVAGSLGVTALPYAPVGLLPMPHRVPSAAAINSVVALGVVCTALAFVSFSPESQRSVPSVQP